ncbi:DUF6878 family protein [Bradyrhizobium genosp. A]|uniref:DUF6878 family protein n=1 Tax=Bradyrhizobium genosp. A TaxID=83626 RepID=UPI003CF3102B
MAAIRPANKAALFDVLDAAGITRVVIEFDGSGDSGQIERITALTGDKLTDLPEGQIELARVLWGGSEIERATTPIRDAIEQLAYDCLEETHGGWENNEGAYGEFTFDVASRIVTLDYNQRVEDSVFSQHEL